METYIDTVMHAAQAGDDRVMTRGTASGAMNEKWMQQSHDRVVRARTNETRRRGA